MLHVPFISAPGITFAEEVIKTAASCTALIQHDTDAYNGLVVKLKTIEQARDKFFAVQRAMLAASLMAGCGIRIKNDLKIFDDVAQLPSETNQPFACPQERSRLFAVLSGLLSVRAWRWVWGW